MASAFCDLLEGPIGADDAGGVSEETGANLARPWGNGCLAVGPFLLSGHIDLSGGVRAALAALGKPEMGSPRKS
jgi:hypothetical protein